MKVVEDSGSRFHYIIRGCVFYFPFLILAVLLLLSFYCGPAAEDLAINYYSRNNGVITFLKAFYFTEGSRYFSFSLVTVICHAKFLMEHYYIASLSLFICFWFTLFALIKSVSGIFTNRIPLRWIAWLATVLFIAFCSVLFEMGSFFYWISGSFTYQPAFILFLCLVLMLITLCGRNRQPGKYYLIFGLLVFLIAGSNEIGLFFTLFFLCWFQCLHYSITRKLSRIINFCLALAILCAALLVIPSGVSERAGNFKVNFPVVYALLIGLGSALRLFFRAFSSPFAWLVMVFAVVSGTKTPDTLKGKLQGKLFLRPAFILTSVFLASLFFYFMINVFSGELLPPRANNLMIAFVFFWILLACYGYGIGLKGGSFTCEFLRNPPIQLLILLVLLNSYFAHFTVYNSITGFAYYQVMKGRIQTIELARRQRLHRVVLRPFAEDLLQQEERSIPAFLQTILHKRMASTADWMHFQDPVADTALYIHYFAEYHQIDTINYLGKNYERIGLIKKNAPE